MFVNYVVWSGHLTVIPLWPALPVVSCIYDSDSAHHARRAANRLSLGNTGVCMRIRNRTIIIFLVVSNDYLELNKQKCFKCVSKEAQPWLNVEEERETEERA